MKSTLHHRIILLLIFTYVFILCPSAQATKSLYDISLDENGDIITGSGGGYGAGWYYYPNSEVYRQWFYNDPYDSTRIGDVEVWIYIEVVDPNLLLNVSISCGWSTPAWVDEGTGAPPLPADVADPDEESLYINERSLYSKFNALLGESSSIEPRIPFKISNYNPEWICITVAGDNVHVYRWIDHVCIVEEVMGACCHRATGECYMSTSADCLSTREWLGVGTTCDDCEAGQPLDYGDAPEDYPVLLTDNGARHIIGADVYLGDDVSAEDDGKPDVSAAGDEDDGVQFLSTLIPGRTTAMKVKASTLGVLNVWLDTNQDGDWMDLTEQVLTDWPLVPGDNTVQFTVPQTSWPGESYMRFRFSTDPGLEATGEAQDGEVEDYMVSIIDPALSLEPQSPSTMFTPLYKQRLMSPDPGQLFIAGWPALSNYITGPIVTDDFISISSQLKIVGIRWWGAFEGWKQPTLPADIPSAFHIGIWSHDIQQNGPSALLWEHVASTWTYAFSGFQQGSGIQGLEPACFEFVQMLSQPQWFDPNMDNIPQYWLSVAAVYEGMEPEYPWGWSTRPDGIWLEPKRILPGDTDWPPQVGTSGLDSQSLPCLLPGNWSLSFELLGLAPDPNESQQTFLFRKGQD